MSRALVTTVPRVRTDTQPLVRQAGGLLRHDIWMKFALGSEPPQVGNSVFSHLGGGITFDGRHW